MTRSRSFFYFRGARRALLLLCAASALSLAPGCSRNSLNEKADSLNAQALDAVRQLRYAEAERLFNDALPLYAQADNPDKFNETTAALADLERKRGKLSCAFMHFHAARSYFEQKNDAPRITSISIALADLYIMTGRRDSAALFAQSALKSSTGAGSDEGRAASEYELGRIILAFGDLPSALPHLERAARFASSLHPGQLSVDIAVLSASAFAASRRQEEALHQLSLASRAASSIGDGASQVRLHAASGAVYLALNLYENAMLEFSEGLKIDSTTHAAGMNVQLLCGIAEALFAKHAYAEAQQYFSKAHDLAAADQTPAAMGYCLLRMGECEERVLLHAPSAPAVLRAVTFYRDALNVFRNDPSPQRIARALLKEASLRASLHEDADAEPLYQSAFDLMRLSSAQSFGFTEPYILTDEARLLPAHADREDWWYRPYASFLLRKRRIGEALAVLVDGKGAELRRNLSSYPIAFQDSVRFNSTSAYLATIRAASIAESELMLRQSLAQSLTDQPDTDSLRIRFRSLQHSVIDEGGRLLSRYPSLLPLINPPAKTTAEAIEQRIPAEGTLVSYAALSGRLYAIILPARATAVAVDLGRDSSILSQIEQYRSLVRTNAVLAAEGQPTDNAAVRQASSSLSAMLLQPIVRHLSHRIIFHASEELGALPMHALALSDGKYAARTYEITYAPLLNTKPLHEAEPPLRTLTVFGAPASGSLEAEYELRSIKNFYPDASLIVTQASTEKNFLEASGDVLHLSTLYGRDDLMDYSTVAFSGGSITASENYRPASVLLLARPFRMWVLGDLRRDSCATAPAHAVFAMMSGAIRCVLQRYPCGSPTAKEFNKFFYTSLLAQGGGRTAYHQAIVQMQQKHPNDAAIMTAPFFLWEW